jgi:hypothetical protein
MFESLLSSGHPGAAETGDVVFLYDPVTNTDLVGGPAVTTLSGGAVADETILINGQPTLKFPSVTAKHVITFPTDLNLVQGNWTLEWSFINNSAPTAYANDFVMYSRTGGAGVGLYTRFGDGGFLNRWVLSDPRGAATPSLTQPLPFTKAALVGLTTNVALVSIAGVIRVYVNGVATMMALGNGSTNYNQPTFIAEGMDKIYAFGLGDVNSTVRAVPGNRGRIRLSNFARYKSNYTPGPLTL